MKILFILFLIGFSWKLYSIFTSSPVSHGPGVTAPNQPKQKKIDPISFKYDEYTITQFATFSLKAKVLSKENYSFGKESDLSPMDLALGWSYMSD